MTLSRGGTRGGGKGKGGGNGGVSTIPSSIVTSTATTSKATTPTPTTAVATSVTSVTSAPCNALPRRDLSDEFGTAGSLGSMGGSEVGSSLHSSTNHHHNHPLEDETETQIEKDGPGVTIVDDDGDGNGNGEAELFHATLPMAAVAVASPSALTIPKGGGSATTTTNANATTTASNKISHSTSPNTMPAPPPPQPTLPSTPLKLSVAPATPLHAQATPPINNTSIPTANTANTANTTSSTTNTVSELSTRTPTPIVMARKSSLKSDSSRTSTTSTSFLEQQQKQQRRPANKRKGSVDFTLDLVETATAAHSPPPQSPPHNTPTDALHMVVVPPLHHDLPPPPPLPPLSSLPPLDQLHSTTSSNTSTSTTTNSNNNNNNKVRSDSQSIYTANTSSFYSLGRLLRADTLDSSLSFGVNPPTNNATANATLATPTTATAALDSTVPSVTIITNTSLPLQLQTLQQQQSLSLQSLSSQQSLSSRLRSDTLEQLDALGDEARLAASRIRIHSTTSYGGGGGSSTCCTDGGTDSLLQAASVLNSSGGGGGGGGNTRGGGDADSGADSMDNHHQHSSRRHHSASLASHRLLLEAFMGGDSSINQDDHDMDDDDDDDEDNDNDNDGADDYEVDAMEVDEDAESLVDSHAAEQAETHELTKEEHRDRFESFDVAAMATAAMTTSRDRLGSFDHHVRDRLASFDHHVRDRLGSFDVRDRLGSFDIGIAAAAAAAGSHHYNHHQHSYESLRRRDRLESWGGMSDLSIPVPDSTGTDSLIGMGSTVGGSAGGMNNSTAALAAAVYTSLANDLSAAANLDGSESISDFLVHDHLERIPSKISMSRDRLNSVYSTATDLSISLLPIEPEMPSEIQNFVKQAMASVGDQLAGIAVAEMDIARDLEDQSEISSTASPMIGAILDASSKPAHRQQRPRSSSLTTGIDIAVDYAAVAAAVNAAEAAAGAIDLAVFAHSATASVASNSSSAQRTAKRKRPKLPTKTIKKAKTLTPPGALVIAATSTPKRPLIHIELPPIPKSKIDERDMEIIRERARAAAGYVPPVNLPPIPPSKIKSKFDPQTPNVKASGAVAAAISATPRTIPSMKPTLLSTPYTPASSYMSTPGSARSSCSKGQSSQKWDSMFDCLLEFVEDRRKEDCVDMSDAEKKAWVWDGNVPTTFKAKDGKALGRWINNQRSAKSKGVLKDDREKRLVDAGLKWSVLASNSWNEMLDELRTYVNEQTRAGRKWDGNVPTNYRIATKPGVIARDDEDKNLGRWVNRQRSLYQSGKLRKDRQLALEKVGLKWSMLATTSWESMFETLLEYVQEKTEDGSEWDGNVPANHRTVDNPPRALGRWINRQRSAYGKNKLKKEYVEKLNNVGLKWSVHERRPGSCPDTPGSAVVSAPSSGTDSSPFPNQVSSSSAAASASVPKAEETKSLERSAGGGGPLSVASSSSSCSSTSQSSKEDLPPAKITTPTPLTEDAATNGIKHEGLPNEPSPELATSI